MTVSMAAYGIVLVFAGLALWEAVRTGGRERPLHQWTAVAAGALGAVLLVGVAGIFLGAECSDAWARAGDLVRFALIEGAVALILLEGTLLHRLRAGRRVAGRAFPLLEVYCLGRNAKRLRRRAWSERRLAEFALFLFFVLGFTAVWMQVGARVFHAEIHEDFRSFFPKDEEMDLAFAISVLLPIVLAPFFEEVIFRGYILDRTVRFLRGRGQGRGRFDAAAGIVFTSALWAVQHEGVIAPEWVKWAQIFGVGIFLGAARIRLGLEACIALHLIHNLVGGLLVPEALRFLD